MFGIIPNICINVCINIHPKPASICIDVNLKTASIFALISIPAFIFTQQLHWSASIFASTHLTKSLIPYIYCSNPISASPSIWIDILLNIQPKKSSPGICINICIDIHPTTASIFILIFTSTHWTESLVSYISESHLISVSYDIFIIIRIDIHPTTTSPDIWINICINVHPTTASIYINIFINVQPTTVSIFTSIFTSDIMELLCKFSICDKWNKCSWCGCGNDGKSVVEKVAQNRGGQKCLRRNCSRNGRTSCWRAGAPRRPSYS